MFNPFVKNETVPGSLDNQLELLYSELAGYEAYTEEYDKITNQIAKLTKLKKETDPSAWIPSPDATVGAVASVAGILLILHYEKLNVVASKALGFVGKMKS